MTLPVGQISLSQVNTELGISPSSTLITMNDAAVRTLAGVGGSGTIISMSNLQGKSNRVAIPLTISGNTNNYDVYSNRGPTYVPGVSDITVTINPGVVVGSTSTGTYAFLVPSSFSPTDTVTVVNNGTIQGMGGGGGAGGTGNMGGPPGFIRSSTPGVAGGVGGNAVFVNRPTIITNNGNMWAGGGGGGGGGGATGQTGRTAFQSGGGGGGGGRGQNGGVGGAGGAATGAYPFFPGQQLRPGTAGNNGSTSAAGSGGAGGVPSIGPAPGGPGGGGGGAGASGSAGTPGVGYGTAPVNTAGSGAAGGGAGFYIVGNPFVTYPATGSRLGNVS